MNQKFDCVIVLGFMLKDKRKLPNVLKSRLNTAIELYKKGLFSKFIVVGGLSNKKLGITEAEAMKNYLIQKGIDSKDILKEETSTDTIGNAFFLKKKILKPKKWKNLIVITSDFHLERAKIIFKKVLGKGYKIRFVGSKVFDIPMFFYKWLGMEKDLIELTKAFFKGVKDGNNIQIKKLIRKVHPLYSERALKKLIKLSDEELAEKFGIKEELIKKVRKYIERRIKMAGK